MPTRSGPMAQAQEVKIELADAVGGREEEGVRRQVGSQTPGETSEEGRGTARTGRREIMNYEAFFGFSRSS